jgi:hypothetical protein
MKNRLGEHAVTVLADLDAIVRNRVRSSQRRQDLINAFLATPAYRRH